MDTREFTETLIEGEYFDGYDVIAPWGSTVTGCYFENARLFWRMPDASLKEYEHPWVVAEWAKDGNMRWWNSPPVS